MTILPKARIIHLIILRIVRINLELCCATAIASTQRLTRRIAVQMRIARIILGASMVRCVRVVCVLRGPQRVSMQAMISIARPTIRMPWRGATATAASSNVRTVIQNRMVYVSLMWQACANQEKKSAGMAASFNVIARVPIMM